MRETNEGGGLFYFLAGAAVGAALGVLFAPRAGDETREQLADWMKERREKAADLLQKVKDKSSRETSAKHPHDGVAA